MLSRWLPVFRSCFSPGETRALSVVLNSLNRSSCNCNTLSLISVTLSISSSFSLKLFPAIKAWQCHAGIKLHNHVAVFFSSFSSNSVCVGVFCAGSDFRKYWDIIVRQFDLTAADILSHCFMKVYIDLHFLKEIAVLARNCPPVTSKLTHLSFSWHSSHINSYAKVSYGWLKRFRSMQERRPITIRYSHFCYDDGGFWMFNFISVHQLCMERKRARWGSGTLSGNLQIIPVCSWQQGNVASHTLLWSITWRSDSYKPLSLRTSPLRNRHHVSVCSTTLELMIFLK